MATNKTRFVRNMDGASEPFIILGKFQAGSTQAIKRGELLEFTGDTNTAWVPIDSDFDMDSNIAIANEEIKAGDLAGYYEVIVPRPSDIFEYDLAAAGSTAYGTSLYYSSSEAVTVTAGTYIIGTAVGQTNYPRQSHASDDASGDAGSTIKSQSTVQMTIESSNSIYSALQTG